MWEKIVFNLLSNAFKYTLQGGITLRQYARDNALVLEVEDTGVGIPAKELPHMFERFHRVENVVGRTYEGTGIGLSLVKELVGLHNGTISVASEQGKGTTFRVAIPLGKDHLPAEQVMDTDDGVAEAIFDAYVEEAYSILDAPRENILDTAAAEKPTVLVADDNADMRRHIQSILQKHFRVVTAENGRIALDKIKEVSPTLVLSDIMMPVMDGIALLREIKANAATARIPVILLTARAGEESKIEGLETGADDYLVKPFSSNELVTRIKTQVTLARQYRHNEDYIRNLFMQTPVPIAIFKGEDLVCELANDGFLAIVARPREAFVGKPLFTAMPEIREQMLPVAQNIFTTGEAFLSPEYEIVLHRDGRYETCYFNVVWQPVKDPDGKVSSAVVVAVEITAQVHAREKIEQSNIELEQRVAARTAELRSKNDTLQRANRELEAFNYIASHDLQEPLRKIQTFVNLLQSSDHDPIELARLLGKINASSQRMSQLIQSVLSYSRLSQDGNDFSPVDLNVTIDNVRQDYELLIAEKRAVIKTGYLPTVNAIGPQMQQLFSNLLSNALKFCSAHPVINITSGLVNGAHVDDVPGIHQDRSYHCIMFSDNGIGFEPQYSEKIFKLFQRLHSKAEYEGTGIGLSIVHKIIDNHNGFIHARSEKDKGATFTIYLPA